MCVCICVYIYVCVGCVCGVCSIGASLVAQLVKNPPAMQETTL